MQVTIETTKIPYSIGDDTITKLVISPLKGFKEFIQLGQDAAENSKDDNDSSRLLFRERIKHQVKAYNGSDNAISFTDTTISQIPIAYALRIKAGLAQATEDMDGKPEILAKGDGIILPIHVRLGRPIKFQGGKAITELEFKARTLGDIEEALCSDSKGDQTLALLKIATPIGDDLSLTSLPSWAIDTLSMEDGMFILQEVAPSFLESQQEI